MSLSFLERRGAWTIVAALPVVIPAGPAVAQTLTPAVSVEGAVTYSPNPLLLPGKDRGAVLTEATLDAKLTATTTSQSQWSLAGSLSDRRYSRLYGDVLFGNARFDSNFRSSEYISILADAEFRRAPLIDRLTTSVDAGVDPRAVSNAIATRLAVQYNPNAHTIITPEFAAERTTFEGSALLGTTRVLRGGLSVSTETGPSTTIGVRGGGRFSTVGRLDASTWFLNGTLATSVRRDWKVTAELGVERNSLQSGLILGRPFQEDSRILITGRGSMCREGEHRDICLRAGLFSEVSGVGGLQRRSSFDGSWLERLGPRTDFNLLAEYQHAAMGRADLPATDAYRASTTLERALIPTLKLGGTLEYIRRKVAFSNTIDSVFAGLTLRFVPRLR